MSTSILWLKAQTDCDSVSIQLFHWLIHTNLSKSGTRLMQEHITKFSPRTTSKIFFVSAGPTDRKWRICWKVFLGGYGYISRKFAGLYKNILTLCTWRNGLLSIELVYVFPRTEAVSSVLPKICTKNEERCLTLGLGFFSNAKHVRLQCQMHFFLLLYELIRLLRQTHSSSASNTFCLYR